MTQEVLMRYKEEVMVAQNNVSIVLKDDIIVTKLACEKKATIEQCIFFAEYSTSKCPTHPRYKHTKVRPSTTDSILHLPLSFHLGTYEPYDLLL